MCALQLACGGPQERTARPTFDSTDRFGSHPTLLVPAFEVERDEPLEAAFERARQAFRRENSETFDPRRAYATSAASDFAWYFTLNDASDPYGRTNHVFFVATEEWTEERTRAFLLSYLVMPAAPDTGAGRPWFHLISAYPPPWAVEAFFFGNTRSGSLEAALLSELGAVAWAPELVPQIEAQARQILARLDYGEDSDWMGACPAGLDLVYGDIPRPETAAPGVFDGDYVPEATLATIGLLVGDSLRAAAPGAAEWELGEGDPLYPRLRFSGPEEGVMQPIPWMIEFFVQASDLQPSDYCRRMLDRVIGPQQNSESD